MQPQQNFNNLNMGIFINDRAWNIKQANDNYEWEQWHLKRAQEARRKGDLYSARDHERRAKTYHDKGNEYRNTAARSTK